MRHLRQVRATRRASLLYPARNQEKEENPTPEEEEEMPENGYGVASFFDTECQQGKQEEDEDDAVKESMKELLFFDLECRQENGNHEPNLCIVQDKAGEEWIFPDDKTIDEFCEWLFTTEHAGCTVMAHNFQGYHSYFILQYLRKQGVKYNLIMRGAKVLSLKVELFDLLNFLPMKLASLLAKLHFPHFFNKKENEDYVGPIPPATYCNPDDMNPKDREAFMAWHATKKESNYVFSFKEEIVTYGVEFCELFYNITDIDPFRMPLPRPVILCSSPTTFSKIRLASFRPWDIPLRRNSPGLRTDGYCIRPRSAKSIFNTHATVARNASVIISWTVITRKRIRRSKSMAVSGMDARNVTLARP